MDEPKVKSSEIGQKSCFVFPSTSYCSPFHLHMVVEREIGLGGRDKRDGRHSLVWNKVHSAYMS